MMFPVPPPMAYPMVRPPSYPTMPAQPRVAAPAAAPPSRGWTPPRPTVRAQQPDEPPVRAVALPEPGAFDVGRTRVAIPAPEELGVGVRAPQPAAAPQADWFAAYNRLRQLGASCVQMRRVADGRYQFLCLMPTAQPDRTRRIETLGASEGEAVRSALAEVERWMASAR